MVRIEVRSSSMSKWWFSSLFTRKKKRVQPVPPEIDFEAIDSATTLACPTRSRVRGPQGRKKPSRASCPPSVQEVSQSSTHDSLPSKRETKDKDSSAVVSDSNFNQTTRCSDSQTDDSAQLRHSSIPMVARISASPPFDAVQVP